MQLLETQLFPLGCGYQSLGSFGDAVWTLCRHCPTQSPLLTLAFFLLRRAAAGTRCDAGRARFLRADTGSPQPHARPARVSYTHVRARARGDPAPAARCCPRHCCRPRPLAPLPQASD